MRLLSRFPFLLTAVFFSFNIYAQTETSVSGNLLYQKLGNGMNSILMGMPGSDKVELTFYIRAGSAYENDSVNGIARVVDNIIAQKITNRLSGPQGIPGTTLFSYSTAEHTVYKLVTTTSSVVPCLMLLRDSMFGAKISQGEVTRAVNTALQQLEDAKPSPDFNFTDKMLKGLYKQDHIKLEPAGNTNSLKNIDLLHVKSFFVRYYVPNNSILTGTGACSNTALATQIESTFGGLLKGEFNPENVTKYFGIRPVAFTTQFIVEDTTSTPEFTMAWQFPGTSANIRQSYCAHLLTTMLNDKNNFIQIKAGKLGCKKFEASYEANNFTGILRIKLQPSKQNLIATYKMVSAEFDRLDKTLVNETMMDVGKLKFKAWYEELKKTKDFSEEIARHWEYNDEAYFPTLEDSIMKVSEGRMRTFVVDFFNQSAHITGLKINKSDRQSLNVDSSFTDLDENVSKYVIKYRQNITDVDPGDNELMVQNMLQWLKINEDVSVQVNGFSDEKEYNRATNDTLLQFIDSIPTFQKAKKDVIKKGYLRPEMMRALKIVKYFYDHGISAERLSGTSMVFKSNNKQEAQDNMKCTFTLNKYRKSPSLYEYHYGKKDNH